jgi:hypothetical protein
MILTQKRMFPKQGAFVNKSIIKMILKSKKKKIKKKIEKRGMRKIQIKM